MSSTTTTGSEIAGAQALPLLDLVTMPMPRTTQCGVAQHRERFTGIAAS